MVDLRKDLFAEHRESLGQSVWIVVLPAVPLTVYLLLGLLRVFPAHDSIDGVAYVLVGATLWFLFSGLITAPISALRTKGRVAVQASYPLLASICTGWGAQLFDFLVRVSISLVVVPLFQTPSVYGAVLLLPALVPPLLLFAGVGMILGVFSVAIHDLQKLVPIVLQYGFFLSLVIFPLPETPAVNAFLAINPFAMYIDNLRYLVMTGELRHPVQYAVWSIAAVIVFLWALRFFAAADKRIAEHL